MKINKIPKKELEEAEHSLFKAIALIKSEAEAAAFFEDICTPAERQAIADRWQVVPHLKAGKSYREIYDETGVSITTIGRVARCINLGTGGYNVIYERFMKLRSKKIEKQSRQKNETKNSHTKKRTPK